MQRPYFRAPHPSAGSRGGGFRTPPPGLDRAGGGGRFPSPPWAFSNGPYGPRFGSYGGSPGGHTPPREFSGTRGGGNGTYSGNSPGHTPRRSNGSPSYRHSPYQSPGAHSGYQGSPRTSTPHGRERGSDDIEKYYKPSMLQDPWADLQPISVTQIKSKCSSQQQNTHTCRKGRYYNKNLTA